MTRFQQTAGLRFVAMKVKRGFTLIELLVVVSLIALLVALLLPAIKAARVSGRDVACQSNNRQLMQAQLAYVGDFGGMTSVWTSAVPISWRARLAEYAGHAREDDLAGVMHCTNLDLQEFRDRPADPGRGRFAASIGINGAMWFDEWDHRLEDVPSDTITLGEQPVAVQEALFSYDGYVVHGSETEALWFWMQSLGHRPERGFRHSGPAGANYAFADGHVERVGPEDLHRASRHWYWFDGLAYPTAILVGGCSCPP